MKIENQQPSRDAEGSSTSRKTYTQVSGNGALVETQEDIVKSARKHAAVYFLLYKTTNLVNNKYYIGIHKSYTLEFDGYLGSGSLLHKAIKKHGKENFKRKTLMLASSYEELIKLEELAITQKEVDDKKCYNLEQGGRACGKNRTGKNNSFYGKTHTAKTIKRISDKKKRQTAGENNPFYGRRHSEETKNKIRETKASKPYKLFLKFAWITDKACFTTYGDLLEYHHITRTTLYRKMDAGEYKKISRNEINELIGI